MYNIQLLPVSMIRSHIKQRGAHASQNEFHATRSTVLKIISVSHSLKGDTCDSQALLGITRVSFKNDHRTNERPRWVKAPATKPHNLHPRLKIQYPL